MKKILILTLLLTFCLTAVCRADVVYESEDIPLMQPLITEENPVSEDINEASPETEQPIEVAPEMAIEVPVEEPIAEAPAEPVWDWIDPDQVVLLQALYQRMTDSGKAASGWFLPGEYAPGLWDGLNLENGKVVGIELENAAYFDFFPEELLDFKYLETLRLKDTLIHGPLPEELFTLPVLSVLELSGNFFSGKIPPLPEGYASSPYLSELTIADNLMDERKQFLLTQPEYAESAYVAANPLNYPDIELDSGLEGAIPAEFGAVWTLTALNLSGNRLSGALPETFGMLNLSFLDLHDNGTLSVDYYAFEKWKDFENYHIDNLIVTGTPVTEDPAPISETQITEVPEVPAPSLPEQQPMPTEIPQQPAPTQTPYIVVITAEPQPTQKPQKVFVVVTATPEPQWYTATPQARHEEHHHDDYAPRPENQWQQGYSYLPQTYPQGYQNPQYYYQPTATYTVYQNYPTAVPSVVPTDVTPQFGFTYANAQMSSESIPLTWYARNMQAFQIRFYDLNGRLYSEPAMGWRSAAQICSNDVCYAEVGNVPNELLQNGGFKLRLEARDASGMLVQGEEIELRTSGSPLPVNPTAEPTPVPEKSGSLIGNFFRWLFTPLFKLLGF